MSLTGKGKSGLIKHNMSRYDNATRRKIETAISLMIRWISQKDTDCRARRKLMWRSSLQVRITQATEDTQVIISGIGVIEAKIENRVSDRRRGAPVEQVSGCCKCLSPIIGRHGGMDE